MLSVTDKLSLKQEKCRRILETHNCCVLIPSFNNAGTVEKVALAVEKYSKNVFVALDGSTDKSAQLLKQNNINNVFVFKENRGKGAVLSDCLKKIEAQGFQYAITIDADGQHLAEDIALFADRLEKTTNKNKTILIGARKMLRKEVPIGSKLGHLFCNFGFWVVTDILAKDTQSGFRLYPLKRVNAMHYYTPLYEFEIESIIRQAWRGTDIAFLPISVLYPLNRVSHFKKWRDVPRAILLFAILAVPALLFYRWKGIILRYNRDKLKTIWRKHFLKPEEPFIKKATALSIGIAIGLSPLYGLHTLSAIAVSFLFRLNKPITILASNISILPLLPFIIFLSVGLGHIALHGFWSADVPQDVSWEIVKHLGIKYFVGGFILSLIGGLLTFIITLSMRKVIRKNSPKP